MQPNQDKQFQLPATPQLAGLDEKKETKKENKEKSKLQRLRRKLKVIKL